jgi:Tfp pilus assembly protein PilZ
MTRTNLARLAPPAGPRVFRLRAGPTLEHLLMPGEGGEVARLEVSTRDPIVVDEVVRIEISLGPMADEVELDGHVVSVSGSGDGAPDLVLVAFGPEQEPRVRYLRHVLEGRRDASARRYRRVPVDLDVRWRCGRARYASKLSDLSRGGAFIVSRCLPSIGDEVELEILADEPGALQFEAVVSWVRPRGQQTGFGVSFRLTDRTAAAALTDVVRRQERLS